jgi:hypothetical protein
MIPLYNPVLMALPATEEDLPPLLKEILFYLWNQRIKSESIQKRSPITLKRFSDNFGKGGPQIQHPKEVTEELWPNLIQKYLRTLTRGNNTKFNRIQEQMLHKEGCPSLQAHVCNFGRTEWEKTECSH